MTTTTTIDINNINIREFGIYDESFYKKHYDVFRFDDDKESYKQFEELRKENNYFEDEVKEYINELDEEETEDKDMEELIDEHRDDAINKVFDDITAYSSVYYEPRIFNKEIAKKCGLFPFFYRKKRLLALAGGGFDNGPKLDAYQVLTTGYIDSSSKLLSDRDFFEFEFTVGKALTQEVLKAIQKN